MSSFFSSHFHFFFFYSYKVNVSFSSSNEAAPASWNNFIELNPTNFFSSFQRYTQIPPFDSINDCEKSCAAFFIIWVHVPKCCMHLDKQNFMILSTISIHALALAWHENIATVWKKFFSKKNSFMWYQPAHVLSYKI